MRNAQLAATEPACHAVSVSRFQCRGIFVPRDRATRRAEAGVVLDYVLTSEHCHVILIYV